MKTSTGLVYSVEEYSTRLIPEWKLAVMDMTSAREMAKTLTLAITKAHTNPELTFNEEKEQCDYLAQNINLLKKWQAERTERLGDTA